MKEALSATRQQALLSCPRKHYWRYEVRLRRETDADALRFGSAWHRAMEARWQGRTYDECLAAGIGQATDLDELQVATLSGMLAGYMDRYREDIVKTLHPEIPYRMALANSRTFDTVGKIDGLGVLHDGRLALVEHKSVGEDIGSESDYWLRLRNNPQCYEYVLAARALGWDVAICIYDVARKPAIRQKQSETPEQFGERLAADTRERPDFYFARREVPILEDDLAEYQVQRLELSRLILAFRASARRAQRPEHGWPRNIDGFACRRCDYASFCLQNIVPDPALPPAGFKTGA